MIKYKRIYPLRQNGRLAAIVTIVGSNDSSDIFVKFKIRPKENNLALILFNPKTYEYEMMPLEEKMKLLRPVTNLTACIIASRNGMFIEFLMEGSINKARLSTSKLKSIIAMDMYSGNEEMADCGCSSAKQPTPPPSQPETPKADNRELMDYLKQMESGTLPASYSSVDTAPTNQAAVQETIVKEAAITEPVFNNNIHKEETKAPQNISVSTDLKNEMAAALNFNIPANTEPKEQNQTVNTAHENLTREVAAFANTCGDTCTQVPVTEEIRQTCIKTSTGNITVVNKDIPEKINIPLEIQQAQGKYCDFINPFKNRWDGVWWKVQYPDKNWHYIVGRIVVDGSNVSVLGVPGERGTKPVCLESCDMYAIADNGVGYWLMFQK